MMKVSELIKDLQKCHPAAEVWLPNVNNLNIPGYCVLDHFMSFQFAEVESDIMDKYDTVLESRQKSPFKEENHTNMARLFDSFY